MIHWIGNNCGAHTVPYIDVNKISDVAHEASTSKISETVIFAAQRGISEEDATALIVNGFVEVFKKHNGVCSGSKSY